MKNFLLLSSGCLVFACLAIDAMGTISLCDAVNRDDLDNIKEYIKQGRDVNVRSASGYTSLHEAVRGKKLTILDELLQVPNIDVNENSNDDKATPLLIASTEGFFEVVRKLIAKGAVVNIPDKRRSTPLHIAVSNRNEKVVEELLRAPKVNLNSKNSDGKTPLDIAQENLQALSMFEGRPKGPDLSRMIDASKNIVNMLNGLLKVRQQSRSETRTLAGAQLPRLGKLSQARTLTQHELQCIQEILEQEEICEALQSKRCPE